MSHPSAWISQEVASFRGEDDWERLQCPQYTRKPSRATKENKYTCQKILRDPQRSQDKWENKIKEGEEILLVLERKYKSENKTIIQKNK